MHVFKAGELQDGFLGLLVRLLTDVLVDGYNVPHDAGVKKLNAFLPADTRAAIESALSSIEMSRHSMALTNLRLATIMQRHGPIIAASQGFTYPTDLEQAVLAHVTDEFERLGIDTNWRFGAESLELPIANRR